MSYKYAGAHALVRLHERHVRSFLGTWRRAKAAAVILPSTEDPAYASLEALLRHVLSAARGYLLWICDALELSDPLVRPLPDQERIEADSEEYIEHLLDRWRLPLSDVATERFFRPEYESRWAAKYCVEAMLEHAVMHPIRHEYQLVTLLEQQAGSTT